MRISDWSSDVCSSDLFARRRHINAVDIWITHRRRCRGEIDFPGASTACHFDDFLRGRATHDRIVDQQHVLATEFEIDRIELLAYRLLALRLSRHDEGAADVAVLDEALAIMHAEPSRKFGTCDTRGIRDRNDDIDEIGRAHVCT